MTYRNYNNLTKKNIFKEAKKWTEEDPKNGWIINALNYFSSRKKMAWKSITVKSKPIKSNSIGTTNNEQASSLHSFPDNLS